VKPIVSFLIVVFGLILTGCGSNLPLPIFPSETPTLTPTATLTPTPLPSPTPTATPTPLPPAHVELGDQALFYGDYERALNEYQQALTNASEDTTRALALKGIGRCQILTGQPSVAVTTLKSLVDRFPNSPILPQTYYFLGEAYRAQNNLPKAAEYYAKYIELQPGVLDAYLQELRGDLLSASGDISGAIGAYELAAAAPQLGDPTPIKLKIGQMYATNTDYKNAIRHYLAIYDQTQNEYYKAQANTLAGQAYLNMGMPEQAYARYQDSVNKFIQPYDTYTGLVVLVNAGVKVDELQRGLIDYYAGQYGYAIEAFNRYISQNPNHDGTPHHFKALSLLAIEQPKAAIAEWDILIQSFPRDKWWAAAWDEKSSVQWYTLSQYREAADTLLEFVRRVPSAPEAPAYLFEAARILERNNRLTEAAPIWERVMSEYPKSPQGWRSLFLAGITYYRMGTLDVALNTFQRALLLAADAEEQSAADFWIAKTYQAQGKTEQAHTYWEQCADRDPTGYYSVRASEILLGQPPFGEIVKYSLAVNWESERRLADSWMRITFKLDPATDFTQVGDLASEPRFQRGVAFWEIGQYYKAHLEFESLRVDLTPDAANTYRLIPQLVKMGYYRSAIFASRQVLTLAGMDDSATLSAPAYFNHIRFGTFFQTLVQPYAEVENLDPLFVFSVMRQESLFEGFASSGAGARGLMQIMPVTGQEIANSMNWPPNYTAQDLFRPLVSARLGIRYLARQRDAFEGDLFAALAAYNGGPGNAKIWRDLSKKDPDLFIEVIRIKETRDYLLQIYEFTNLYRLIYAK
jgi:soluble lytic murein transglycosylase